MALRPPSFSQGFVSFLWALGFGLYIWLGLLAVGVGKGTAVLFALIAAGLIFFYVRLFGGHEFRAPNR